MDRYFPPLDLVWNKIKWGEIHYSDSNIVNRLRLMPYLEIGVVIIFISITVWGLKLMRKSENNFIYAGMAKETAHQLGTPVSALMGWVDRLRTHPEESTNVVKEMESDLKRLEQIGSRFSKMGSDSELKSISLKELVERLDLNNATFFGQDWGGLVGLRVVAEMPDRFARVVVSNTGMIASEGFSGWIFENFVKFLDFFVSNIRSTVFHCLT